MPALFACLPEARAERLLDMMVEVQGEGWMERAVREMRVVVREGWLGKWGLGSGGRVENQQLMAYGSANYQQPMGTTTTTIPSTAITTIPTLPRHKS